MNSQLAIVENLAQTAIQSATRPARIRSWKLLSNLHVLACGNPSRWSSRLATEDILERALLRLFLFSDHLNQTVLYVLRLMEISQTYRKKGFLNLLDYAVDRYQRYRDIDTLKRLCNVTTRIIAVLDAEPITDPSTGQSVDGLALIGSASTSALIRHSGRFLQPETRAQLVSAWMTGTSDDYNIKRAVGWEPPFGKADALIQRGDDGEVQITIRGREEHARILEKQLGWMLEIHQS